MANCWSCTVIIEQGVKVCPFCGADQSQPVTFVNPDLPQPRTLKSSFRESGIAIMVMVAFVGTLAGIFWHTFGPVSISPVSQASGVAAKSLRDLREALSGYALSEKDSYPATLNLLGERAGLPMQAAQGVGYRLEYRVKPMSADGMSRGFEILARSEKSDYPSLFIDETGVVRAGQSGHLPSAKDPPL